MTTTLSSRAWLLRLLLAAAVLAGAVAAGLFLLRPSAEVAPAEVDTAVRTVQGVIEVKAEYASELKSEVAGRVVKSVLEPGRKVRLGEMLVQMDTGDLALDIERIQNELAAARRRVELGSTLRAEVMNFRDAVANLDRQVQSGMAPAAELEKQRRSLQQLEQRMELDEVGLKLTLANLETALRAREREQAKMSILAPADGVVIQVFARVGDLIGGNTPIASLMANTRTVEAKLSEEHFASVQLGQKATVRFLTHGGNQYNATVSKILPAADPVTQRYTVHLDVQVPEDRPLVPGLTGEVSIITAERPNAVVIPRRALIGDYVYVCTDNRLSLRRVQKGYGAVNRIEITDGLKAGELVLVEEHDRFRDGDRVRPVVVAK